MTGTMKKMFVPNPVAAKVYDRLYAQYRRLHDSHGTKTFAENQFDLMKELLAIRDEARHA
jgi:L-ribulokinase